MRINQPPRKLKKKQKTGESYKNYGLTTEEYEAMKYKSGNTCWICGKPPKKKVLNIDHDHRVEKRLGVRKSVRGLLCHNCNHKIISNTGDRDNAYELFTRAAEYIKLYRKTLESPERIGRDMYDNNGELGEEKDTR